MRAPDGTAWEITGEGAPVALIHGLGLSRRLWDPLLPALSARHRVLAYDLYGHGQSAPLPEPASLALYARQLAGVMNAAGLAKAAVVGFSIGGLINRWFVRAYPQRCAALVVLNAPHRRSAEAQAEVEGRARAAAEEGPMATMDAALERWFTPGFRAASPAVMETVRAWRAEADPASYAGAARVLAEGVPALLAAPPSYVGPALVMTGEHDSGSTPAMSRAIAAETPDAVCQIVPGLRHLGLLETPAAFTDPILSVLARPS